MEEHDEQVRDRAEDERRLPVASRQRVDDLRSVLDEVRILRQEVYHLRTGIAELLHRTQPAPPPVPASTPPAASGAGPRGRDAVYIAAGLAVAAAAALLTIYLFTRT